MKVGSPANLLPTGQVQPILSPSSLFRRAYTEKTGNKGSLGLQSIIGEMRSENRKKENLQKKKVMSSNNLQSLEENLEISVAKKSDIGRLVVHMNSENNDLASKDLLGVNIDESDISTPRKSSGERSWLVEKDSQRSSFCSETPHFGDEIKNYIDQEKPLSMYNMETQTSQLMLNSPTTSDSLLQNMDASSSEHSSLNSPLTRESERNNPIYRKSKFFNKKDALRLPDDEEDEEKKLDGNFGIEGERSSAKESMHNKRKSMIPLSIIPVIKIEKSHDDPVDTKQTEAMIQLKKTILKTKRLISLYEILKDQGKLITDQDIFQKSKKKKI